MGERLDFTDDCLERVLQDLSDDSRWVQFESALNRHTIRVYDLKASGLMSIAPPPVRM